MDELTIEGISYIMHLTRLFEGLDTQDSVASDMNQETIAFSQTTEIVLDSARMLCMAIPGVRPAQNMS